MKNTVSILGRFDEMEISQKIGILFILNKIYLDKDLKIDGFAKKIGIQPRLIAPVFETLYGHRFIELINMYRVEYAKNEIKSGFLNRDTLEVLANRSGFKSKNTFLNVFKKEIGESPNEYSKNCRSEV